MEPQIASEEGRGQPVGKEPRAVPRRPTVEEIEAARAAKAAAQAPEPQPTPAPSPSHKPAPTSVVAITQALRDGSLKPSTVKDPNAIPSLVLCQRDFIISINRVTCNFHRGQTINDPHIIHAINLAYPELSSRPTVDISVDDLRTGKIL